MWIGLPMRSLQRVLKRPSPMMGTKFLVETHLPTEGAAASTDHESRRHNRCRSGDGYGGCR